jgi:hypothetical protein
MKSYYYVVIAYYFFLPFRSGNFAPLRRASDKLIAITCFLLLTFLPERPDLSFPSLCSCIARFTLLEALGPYFRRDDFAGSRLSLPCCSDAYFSMIALISNRLDCSLG